MLKQYTPFQFVRDVRVKRNRAENFTELKISTLKETRCLGSGELVYEKGLNTIY